MKGLNFALLSRVLVLWFRSTFAFRLLHRGVDLYDDFTSYEISYVGQANNPDVSTLENVLEGAPSTRTHPRNWAPASGRQICPGMIGPLGANAYYCHTKEFGSCDRRAGVCHCNTGYEGVDCSSCQPTHYMDGNLCYPKRSCPGTTGGRFSLECSGAGICNYSTGKCQCHSSTRTGDCSLSECMGFDLLCTACTQSYCVGCVGGYYLDENSRSCRSCAHHSQRCAVCNSNSCLKCVDTTVWSHFQPAKPLLTTLESNFGSASMYATFEIGSSDEYEQFRILANSKPPQLCEQGLSGNSSWSCGDSLREVPSGACGHEGTVAWSSSQYAVAEGAKTIRVAIKRSGGGIGVVQVRYILHHITTTESDIAISASYTSSSILQFDDGVTELSFLLAVHDDRLSEGDETAMIELIRPRGGASLGSQRRALLTVIDDDMNRASAFFSQLRSDCIATAGNVSSTVIFAHNGRGTQMQMGGDVFLVELEPIFFSTTSHSLGHSPALKLPYTEGSNWEIGATFDMGNGTYVGSWNAKKAGVYKQRAWMLATGGLKGEYHHGSRFMTERVLGRVDAHVHFTWDNALLQKASFPPLTFGVDLDFVRWFGHLCPSRTGAYRLHVVLHGSGLGVRLWLDGRVLVDGWRTLTRRHHEMSTPVLLTAHHLHSIALELRITNSYYSDFAASRGKGISLEWSAASMSRAVIAPKYLSSIFPHEKKSIFQT